MLNHVKEYCDHSAFVDFFLKNYNKISDVQNWIAKKKNKYIIYYY